MFPLATSTFPTNLRHFCSQVLQRVAFHVNAQRPSKFYAERKLYIYVQEDYTGMHVLCRPFELSLTPQNRILKFYTYYFAQKIIFTYTNK